MEVDIQKHAESLIKMKTFHNIKCKAYLDDRVNSSKRVIRSKELSLVTSEAALGKQGVLDNH